VGKGKDTPEVYEAALRLLGLPKAEVVVFEDAYHAAKTAKDAGFRVVGVYDASEPEADKLRGIAELYTTDYQNLDALFDA
ncbi:MAG: HAD family phosphatase, partial [Clostridiales bacterium]|nr:HAD family phosphatase [Clostridiales bacterium]